MRLGITSKLFGAILLTNVVMALAFGVAIEVSIRESFHDYVKQREERRLATLSQALATEYAKQGDWAFLRGDEDRWSAILRQPPPGRPPDFIRQRPMPPFMGGGGWPKGEPRHEGEGPRGLGGPRRFFDGIVLEDAQHVPVIGQAQEGGETFVVPIVHQGATVGWLKSRRPQMGGIDSQFLEQTLKTGWIIAGIALLLAAIVALPMARRLLAPIRRLTAATHHVSSGDFTRSVEVASSDELGQLTRDFNRLVATLRDADEARRGFLADISHDLRTPLAIVRGELDALHDGMMPLGPQAIASLRSEVARLEHLVNDLYELAVSDLGPVVYQFEEVDVAELAREAAESFRDRMTLHNLTLDTSGIPPAAITARAESRRLMQLLGNLLENSLRYTNPGGRVEIRVRDEGGDAIIDVDDSTPGVDEALRPKLFERLFRVEPSRSRDSGGAGLGLALCRSIARAHGGRIEAKASALGGLWIEVRLPKGGPPEKA